jgi:HD-GYP domain-containing protein (c-di-GMP phosphodiesterase class II)
MTHHAYSASGVLLLAAGLRIEDEAMARRLAAADVRLVHPDAKRRAAPTGPTPEEAGEPEPAPYHEELKRAWQVRAFAVRRVSTVLRRMQAGGQVTRAEIEPVVQPIVASLMRNNTALLSLVRMKSFDRYTFTHSVNVCVLTVVLAREHDPTADLVEVGTGALLHDLGKMRLGAQILNKAAALSPAEFAEVRKHPRYGLEMLSRSPGLVSETILRTVHEHHERHDGSGYPQQLPGDRISVPGRLAAVADTYDAMTSVRSYRARILPKDALAWLYAQRGVKYDPDAVMAFINAMGVYPIGSGVRLGSGEIAMVVGVNRDHLARPTVMIVRDRRGSRVTTPGDLLDLATDTTEQIVSHVDLLALGISPAKYLATPAL